MLERRFSIAYIVQKVGSKLNSFLLIKFVNSFFYETIKRSRLDFLFKNVFGQIYPLLHLLFFCYRVTFAGFYFFKVFAEMFLGYS